MSLKRRKGPRKELFSAEGGTAIVPDKTKEKDVDTVTFDLGFEVLEVPAFDDKSAEKGVYIA